MLFSSIWLNMVWIESIPFIQVPMSNLSFFYVFWNMADTTWWPVKIVLRISLLIIFRNVPFQCSQDELGNLFTEYGPINYCVMLKDESDVPRGKISIVIYILFSFSQKYIKNFFHCVHTFTKEIYIYIIFFFFFFFFKFNLHIHNRIFLFHQIHTFMKEYIFFKSNSHIHKRTCICFI